jgi:hypothetical protein
MESMIWLAISSIGHPPAISSHGESKNISFDISTTYGAFKPESYQRPC